MMHHSAMDPLAEYGIEDFLTNKEVINPTWRELTQKKNSLLSKLRYFQARFAGMTIHPRAEEDSSKRCEQLVYEIGDEIG